MPFYPFPIRVISANWPGISQSESRYNALFTNEFLWQKVLLSNIVLLQKKNILIFKYNIDGCKREQDNYPTPVDYALMWIQMYTVIMCWVEQEGNVYSPSSWKRPWKSLYSFDSDDPQVITEAF